MWFMWITVGSVFFWVLVALAAALSLGSFFSLSNFFGTAVYPVTRVMSSIMSGTVSRRRIYQTLWRCLTAGRAGIGIRYFLL